MSYAVWSPLARLELTRWESFSIAACTLVAMLDFALVLVGVRVW